MTKYIRKTRSTKKKYSVNRCGAVKTFSENAYFSGDGKGTLSHDIKQLIEQNKK